jgi:hypothetical protein
MATAGSVSSMDNTASSPGSVPTNSAAAAGAASAPASVFKKKKHIAFWDIDGPGVDAWIGTIPGPFQTNGTISPVSGAGDDKEKNNKDGSPASNPTAAVANQGTYDRTIPFAVKI